MPHGNVHDVGVPDFVRGLSRTGRVKPLYRNDNGGITFQLDDGASYVKLEKPSADWDLAGSVARFGWVRFFVTAPEPLRFGHHDGLDWLETAGLSDVSAVDPVWSARRRRRFRRSAWHSDAFTTPFR